MRKTSDVNGAKFAKPQSGLALNKQIKARTPDLLHAMQALYQLSYSPIYMDVFQPSIYRN